jgi:protein-tyrosine phosphatase/membrane-associated phospholipid phosphatase
MGHFHRVARPANFRMNKPTKLSALGASVGLSLCFIVVYGACNYLTAHRTDVGMWHFEWEKYIPLLTWFIVPYMSIDLFFAAAPFLCKSREELAIHAKRIVFAILIAGGIFLIMPLKLVITRPEPTDWTGPIFQFLHSFDEPHNLFPSLHITLRAILADLYARRTKGGWRVAMHVWFSLIGFSTILVGQHHVPDVLGGFVLAAFCLYLFPTAQPVAPGLAASSPLARYYIGGAALCYGATFIRWPYTAWFLYPAFSLTLVAAAYLKRGPIIFRKSEGKIPFSARFLLGPYLLGQYFSRRYYRRKCAAWDEVTPRVWIGARLTAAESAEARQKGVTAVLDLTAECAEERSLRQLTYLNIPVLDLTAPTLEQLQQAAEFIAQQEKYGVVYVHCKIGYSRSAAAVGAYLLSSGAAATVDEVVAQLRRVRPSIILRPEVLVALREFQSALKSDRLKEPFRYPG